MEDETNRRKKVEQERDILIQSLNEMTERAKGVEKALREFEKENVDLYERLKRCNQELTVAQDRNNEVLQQLADVQLEKEKIMKEKEEFGQLIESQKLLIGKQSMEITELKTTNRAYDISNKENVKNMNAVMEKMMFMSNERQKVKYELENIIHRRKSSRGMS